MISSAQTNILCTFIFSERKIYVPFFKSKVQLLNTYHFKYIVKLLGKGFISTTCLLEAQVKAESYDEAETSLKKEINKHITYQIIIIPQKVGERYSKNE